MKRFSVERDVPNVLAPFCAVLYIKVREHSLKDEACKVEWAEQVQKNNVELYRTHYTDEPTEFQSHCNLEI